MGNGPGLQQCTHTDPATITDPLFKTQSHPGPKARWTLYVHTQETIDHTLLTVAVCSTTVVIRSQCACETVVRRRVITNRVAYLLYAGLVPQ